MRCFRQVSDFRRGRNVCSDAYFVTNGGVSAEDREVPFAVCRFLQHTVIEDRVSLLTTRASPTAFFLVQVTDGFVTADEEEDEGGASQGQGAAAMLRGKGEAAKDMAKDMKKRTKNNLESLKAKDLGEAVDRADGDGDGDGEDAKEGDLRARLPKGGKVDVSYV